MGETLRVGVSGKVLRRNVGGNSTYAVTLYRHLAEMGVRAHLLESSERLPGRLRTLGYATADGFGAPLLTSPDKLDLLHFPADTGALVPGRVPIVATIHGMASLHVPGVRRPLPEKMWRLRVGRLGRAADAVVTVSESSARDLAGALEIPAARLHVIPHGVDADRFHPGAEGDAELLAPLDLPGRFVFYLGNLDPRKNVPALVEAMEDPAVAGLGVPLVVAGRPAWDSEPILRALEQARDVRYLGPVKPELVAPLLRAATVFAFPSQYEGFGLPVLEAMACGTPVVTSARGSLPEVCGDAAVVARDLSPAGIAAGLAQVLADDSTAADLRERGLANAARFSWERSARLHRDLFTEVAARGGAR